MNANLTATRVVDELLRDGLLHPDARPRAEQVVSGVLGAGPAAEAGSARAGLPKLVEVLAYLGAALVIAAAWLFLMQSWSDLSVTAQSLALAGVAVVLAIGGLVAGRVAGGFAQLRGPAADDARRRLTSTMLGGAAVTAGIALAIALDAALDPHWKHVFWPGVAAAGLAVVLGVVGYWLAPSALGQLVVGGGLLLGANALTNGSNDHQGMWIGIAYVVLAAVWLVLAERGLFREQTVARFLGVAVLVGGAQAPVISDPEWLGYLLTAGAAVAGVLLYLARQAWPYLALTVVAVTLVVPEVASDWLGDSLGVIGGVLVAGVTLLLASLGAHRLRTATVD